MLTKEFFFQTANLTIFMKQAFDSFQIARGGFQIYEALLNRQWLMV